jgi:hypothetical protein
MISLACVERLYSFPMTSIICSDSSGIWVNKILKDYFLKGYAVSKKIDRIEDMESVIQPILMAYNSISIMQLIHSLPLCTQRVRPTALLHFRNHQKILDRPAGDITLKGIILP